MPTPRCRSLAAALLVAAACGGTESESPPPYDPYSGEPPLGAAIDPETEGTPILDANGDPTGWTWIPVDEALCNDATLVDGSYVFSTSGTGLAIKWGAIGNTDLVVFLQGGGACWDFVTCGGAAPLSAFCPVGLPDCFAPTATTGPFGPAQFAAVMETYPDSWLASLPADLASSTVVFVPYCTGDVHGGNRATTYTRPPELAAFDLPPVTWEHRGHANLMRFLERLGATFPTVSKLVVAGSSAGGFGALANYPAFRWYWPNATSYLIDDSGPPLIDGAIPSSTRAAWYANWDLGVSLDAFCTGCRADMSAGLTELASRFPGDRIALVSHIEDDVIRAFFGTYTLTPPAFNPMPIATFKVELGDLGASVIAPLANARYFFTNSPIPGDHPALDDPAAVVTPDPGLETWMARMVSDDPVIAATWTSVADP